MQFDNEASKKHKRGMMLRQCYKGEPKFRYDRSFPTNDVANDLLISKEVLREYIGKS